MGSIESTLPPSEPDREALLSTPITIDGETHPARRWFDAWCGAKNKTTGEKMTIDDVDTATIAEFVDDYAHGRDPHAPRDTAA